MSNLQIGQFPPASSANRADKLLTQQGSVGTPYTYETPAQIFAAMNSADVSTALGYSPGPVGSGTLTAVTLNGGTIVGGTANGINIGQNSAAAGAFTTLTADAGTLTGLTLNGGTLEGTISAGGLNLSGSIYATGTFNAATLLAGGVSVLTSTSIQAGGTFGSGSFIPQLVIGTDGIVTSATNIAVAGSGITPGAGLSFNSGTLSVEELVNLQTITGYTIAAGDAAKLVNLDYVLSGTYSLASGSYAAGFYVDLLNSDGSFLDSIIPSSGDINGQGTLYLSPRQGAHIVFDGTNYAAIYGSPWLTNANGGLQFASGGLQIGGSTNTGSGSVGGVAIGTSNTVTINSLAIGIANVITGPEAAAVGVSHHTASYSLSIGYHGDDSGNVGSFTQGFSQGGFRAQRREFGMYAFIVGGTVATRLVSIGGPAGVTNVGVIPAGGSAGFELRVHVKDTTNNGCVDFIYGNGGINSGQIANFGTAAATTTIASGGTFAQTVQLGSIQALGTMAVSADTTYGGFNLTYTPGVGNTATLSVAALLKLLET